VTDHQAMSWRVPPDQVGGESDVPAQRRTVQPRSASPRQVDLLRAVGPRFAHAIDRVSLARLAAHTAQTLVDAEKTAFVLQLIEGPRVAWEVPAGAGALAPWGALIAEQPWRSRQEVCAVISTDPVHGAGGSALLAVPILTAGRVAGALLARRREILPFTAADADALRRLARHAGRALLGLERLGSVQGGVPMIPPSVGDRTRLLADLRGALRPHPGGHFPVVLAMLRIPEVGRVRAGAGPGPAEELMRAATNLMVGELRVGDELYRWSEDTLAMLMTPAEDDVVTSVIGRLREVVQDAALDAGAAGGADTASLRAGWAAATHGAAEQLVALAESALAADHAPRF